MTALAAGKLKTGAAIDTLLVCSETNLMAYDVERNADLFFKEIPDGVHAVAIGTVSICSSSNRLPINTERVL